MKNKTQVIADPGKQELFITREFEASPEIVFKAFTKPELLSQWHLSKEHNMRIDYFNAITGGAYRFIVPGMNGGETGISGVFHEVNAPIRIIRTFEFEGLPERGHLALLKTAFENLPGGRTKVTLHYICESVGYRDGLVNSGMEKQTASSFDKLDDVLSKEKVKA